MFRCNYKLIMVRTENVILQFYTVPLQKRFQCNEFTTCVLTETCVSHPDLELYICTVILKEKNTNFSF